MEKHFLTHFTVDTLIGQTIWHSSGTVWHSIAQVIDCADRKVLSLNSLVSGQQNRWTRTHTEFPPLPPQDSDLRAECDSFYNIRQESSLKITNNNQGEAK